MRETKSTARSYAFFGAILLMMAMVQQDADAASNQQQVAYTNKVFHQHAHLKQTAKQYLTEQALAYPGEVQVRVGRIDNRLKLPQCPSVFADLPNGRKAWGKTSVRLSCTAPNWQIYVQAEVKVIADYLIAAVPLSNGQQITAQSVTFQKGDLTHLPAGVYTDIKQVEGLTTSRAMAAGTALSQYMVKITPVIQQGQTVLLFTEGKGFSISAEGRAINKAMAGQVVRVKVANGQVISGVAGHDGKVRVSF